ncbi:MAG: conjugative transposon protein TraM [Porphyromonas sp.]|jgi:conjugative transposon TraM protein|nr:conjugative transposon protein TraM [Porphyromonas sp.]
MDALKKINWKQPKYMIPLIIYFPLLFVGYFVIDLFHTEKAEIPDGLATTEYLNPDLPEAKMKGDGIGNKYESMLKSYGKIDDYSALGNIERNEEDTREEYESKYTDEEREQLEAQEAAKLAEMQRQLQESAQKGQEIAQGGSPSEEDRIARSKQREQEAMDELNRAIAQARLQAQQSMMPAATDTADAGQREGKVEASDKKKTDDDEPQEVVKKVKVTSDYFNTLCDNDKETSLIKAIIDENIKAVDGSRVRLRLLDDIEINDVVVPKGSYLYATMSGFGSQRVKGNVQSIMVDDDIVKVSLALYDTDGLEGLYVPSSQFRETTKDVGSGALSNTSSLTNSSTTSGNSLATWGAQTITNAVQKTSNAISKAIKKNNAKLKYGTFVYLINSRSNKKDK